MCQKNSSTPSSPPSASSKLPMSLITTTALLDTQHRLHLLDAGRADVVEQLAAAQLGPPALTAELVKRGLLTPYQVNEIFQERGDSLVFGSYVLLEQLGQGGMGTVFKARNWKLDR